MFGRKKKEIPIRQPRIISQNESYSFRRSRTLTGSTAGSVRAVGEDRAQLKSPRIHLHELRTHRRRLLVRLLLVFVMGGGLWGLISQFTGSINEVATQANPALPTAQYIQLMDKYFQANPLERFRFALHDERLMQFLNDKAPELLAARLEGNGLGRSSLSLTFRRPVVVWEIGRQKYYVDESGVAFRKNYYPEPPVVVKDESGIDPSSGAIASNRFLHFLGRVVTLVNESGVATVKGVIIPPDTTREVDLQLNGKDYIVKTQLDRDPAGQVIDIVNALKFVESKGIKPRYVDVRIAGKAYYQ